MESFGKGFSLRTLQNHFAAKCSVRPVTGSTEFQGESLEAQPRRYTFHKRLDL